MPERPPETPEGLPGGGRLRGGVVDPEGPERVDDRADAELILDGDPQAAPIIGVAEGDDRDRGAVGAALLFGEHFARHCGRVGEPRSEHERIPRGGDRIRETWRDRGTVAAGHRIRDGRGVEQNIDEDDDLGGCETGQTGGAPLDTNLIAGLIERRRHPFSVGSPSPAAPTGRHKPSATRRRSVRHWGMRILQKFQIDCDPDAAWRALHSPRAVAELYGPLLDVQPLSPPPTAWEPGQDAAVGLFALGIVPLGRQLIAVSDRVVEEKDGQVRIFRDSGSPLTGPLATLDVWDHQMAISPVPGAPGRTIWRERLVIGGRTAPALWPVLWTMWQWRGARIRALAPTWAHDPEA